MNSLGFAPNPGLGLVYEGAFILLPAQHLVLTVQRRHAADEVRELTFDEAVARKGARLYPAEEMVDVELTRPFTGHRLTIEFMGGKRTRYILQKESVEDVRRSFSALLGERFRDSTGS